MREITKSALSLSWAMSLFGLKQLAGLFAPGSNAAGSFAAVTRCAEDQLGPATQATFRAGDNMQRGLVDLAFAFFTLGTWMPGRGGSGQRAWGQGAMGGGMTGAGSAPASGGCASCGSAGASAASVGGSAAQAAGDLTSQAMGAGIDLVQQGVNAAYQAMGGGSAAQPAGTGWGPVLPPGFQMMGGG